MGPVPGALGRFANAWLRLSSLHSVCEPFRGQTKLLIVSGLAWVADAMEVMILSFLGPALKCSWGLSSTEESLITTVVFIGMAIGSNSWGVLADAYGVRADVTMSTAAKGSAGAAPCPLVMCSVFHDVLMQRKTGVLVAFTTMFALGLASAFSPNYAVMLVTRGITGIGIAGIPVALSMFLEVVPTQRRGWWACVLQMWWTVGTVGEALLAWAVIPHLGWRWLLALSATPFVVLVTLYWLLVLESPRFLLVQGRTKDASAVIAEIARQNGQPNPLDRAHLVVAHGPTEMTHRASLNHHHDGDKNAGSRDGDKERQGGRRRVSHDGKTPLLDRNELGSTMTGKSSGREEWTPPRWARVSWCRYVFQSRFFLTLLETLGPLYRQRTLLLWVVWLTEAFCYYGAVLFTTADAVNHGGGCNGRDMTLGGKQFQDITITSFAEFPGIVVSALLVDYVGRRAIQTTTLVVAAIVFGALIPISSETMQTWIMFVGRAALMGAFTITTVFTPELFPTRLRAAAFGTANSFSRVGGMVAPFVGQGLQDAGQRTLSLIVFGGTTVVASVASFFMGVETAGKQLGDLDEDDNDSEREEERDGDSSWNDEERSAVSGTAQH